MSELTAPTQERFHTKPFESFHFRQHYKNRLLEPAPCTLHLYSDKNCVNQFNEMNTFIAVKGGQPACKEVMDSDPGDKVWGNNSGAKGPARSALIMCNHTGIVNSME